MLYAGQRLERYEARALLGQGGMAMVFRVRHLQLQVDRALKLLTVIHPSVRARLMQEGRLQANLVHPNLVAVSDVVEVAGQPGLVMEYIPGPSLQQWLAVHRPSLDEALALFHDIGAGMAWAHERGLVHRDIKPGNVLVLRKGDTLVPKVTDFGLAKVVGATSTPGGTRTGAGLGTPAYMAPEQIRGARDVDHRADIFSLGCLLYELVCGTLAFPQEDLVALFNALAQGAARDPREHVPDLPDAVADTIRACLRPDPADRPTSCLAVLEGLPDPRPIAFSEAALAAARPPPETPLPRRPDPRAGPLPAPGAAPASPPIGGRGQPAAPSPTGPPPAATAIPPASDPHPAPRAAPPSPVLPPLPDPSTSSPGRAAPTLGGFLDAPDSAPSRPALANSSISIDRDRRPPHGRSWWWLGIAAMVVLAALGWWLIDRLPAHAPPGAADASSPVADAAPTAGTKASAAAPGEDEPAPATARTPLHPPGEGGATSSTARTAPPGEPRRPSRRRPADAPRPPAEPPTSSRASAPASAAGPAGARATAPGAPAPGPTPTEHATPEPTPAAPEAPVERTPPPASTPHRPPATFRTVGDAARVALHGQAGLFGPGEPVPPGRYDVYVTFPGQKPIPSGSVELGPGEALTLRCDAAFEKCTRQR